MTGNPYYHEMGEMVIDPKFIVWSAVALAAAIVLTMLNTGIKPITWRCRGIDVTRSHMRAARRLCGVPFADRKENGLALVLPSTSWCRILAMIVTGIILWQGMSCHGYGLIQLCRNKFYPFNGIVFVLGLTIAVLIAYAVIRRMLRAAMLVKVAYLSRICKDNHVSLPPVIEKWGLGDIQRRAAILARKRKAEAGSAKTESRKEIC